MPTLGQVSGTLPCYRRCREHQVGPGDRGAVPTDQQTWSPVSLRYDNGPECVSKALLKWAIRQSLDLALIEPGKPWQNGLNESFNVKFRDECLSMEWFRCRAEERVVIEEWRRHYNSFRSSSAFKPEQHDGRT